MYSIEINRLKSRRRLKGEKLYSVVVDGIDEMGREKILTQLSTYRLVENKIFDPHFHKGKLWFLLYSPLPEKDIKLIINMCMRGKNKTNEGKYITKYHL